MQARGRASRLCLTCTTRPGVMAALQQLRSSSYSVALSRPTLSASPMLLQPGRPNRRSFLSGATVSGAARRGTCSDGPAPTSCCCRNTILRLVSDVRLNRWRPAASGRAGSGGTVGSRALTGPSRQSMLSDERPVSRPSAATCFVGAQKELTGVGINA